MIFNPCDLSDLSSSRFQLLFVSSVESSDYFQPLLASVECCASLISWTNYKLHQLNAVPVSSVEFLSIISWILVFSWMLGFHQLKHGSVFISWIVTSHQLNVLHLDKITWHLIFTISHPILPIRWQFPKTRNIKITTEIW